VLTNALPSAIIKLLNKDALEREFTKKAQQNIFKEEEQ